MKRKYISGGDYSQLLETTRYSDSTEFDVNRIVEIYEYLKDKKTDERSYEGKVKVIENAHLDFLRIALGRIYFSPNYNQGTEDFLKSDYLSEELKKEILDVLNGNCFSEQLKELLNSDRQMNSFSKEEIKEIQKFLHQIYDSLPKGQKKKKCGEIYEIFEDYIFVIDGVGPIEYIKEKNGENLPIIILEKSGIPSHASYYSGYGVDRRYLGEKHLFSIYKKFVKYYPEKAEKFVAMVRSISRLTPTEFVTNYLLFVRNGLDSGFKNKEGNISIDDEHGSARDLVGAATTFSLLSRGQSDLDRRFELDEQIFIRDRFSQMIEEFKSAQESEETKHNDGKKVKVQKYE